MMYLLIGLAIGAGLLALLWGLRGKNIVVRWYEWLIAMIGTGLLLYFIQNITSFAVSENRAPVILFLLLGLPALILIAVSIIMPWLRQIKKRS